MQLYRVFDEDSDAPTRWCTVRGDAQELMRKTHPQYRCNVKIELCEVPVDKENVLAMLDGQKIALTVIKSWHGTARGGMAEVVEPL